MKLTYVVFLTLFLLSSTVYANPFAAADSSSERASGRGVAYKIIEYQNSLRTVLTHEVNKLKEGGSSSVIFFVFSVCLLYGAVHAIGPGHNKGIVSAYVISGKKSRMYAASIGFLTGLLHGLSSIALILFIYYLSSYRLSRTFDIVSSKLTVFSAVGITAVGLWLLFSSFRNCDDGRKKSVAVVFFGGLVPCPAIFIVMAFFISSGFPLLGLASALFLTLGMSLTLSIIAAGASEAAALITKGGSFHTFLERASALAIITLGLLLFITVI